MTDDARTPAGAGVVRSAGILLTRGPEVLVAHMGGPFWAGKETGAWTIPKGEYDPAAEDPLDAARREFLEELGIPAPEANYRRLGEVRVGRRKVVLVFSAEADLDVSDPVFGTFTMPWPPKSGRIAEFPEVDRVAWVDRAAANELLTSSQRLLLDLLPAAG